MKQHARQRVTIALPAREYSELLEHIVVGKQKTSQQITQLGHRRSRRDLLNVIQHAPFRIENFVLVLGEIVRLSVVSERILSGSERLAAIEHANQCRLARSIHS